VGKGAGEKENKENLDIMISRGRLRTVPAALKSNPEERGLPHEDVSHDGSDPRGSCVRAPNLDIGATPCMLLFVGSETRESVPEESGRFPFSVILGAEILCISHYFVKRLAK